MPVQLWAEVEVSQKPWTLPLFEGTLGKEYCWELKRSISLRSASSSLGDCGLPPEVPNAQPTLEGSTSFPEKTTITYKCNEGFVKIPGKPDSVVCLSNNQWSEFIEFCNRSCDVPTRLLFASLKKDYNMQNYFPVGFTVEYECRPGYARDPSQSVKLTCLQNLTWSKAAEFCKKKSCPNPGELRNGDINITTGLFYGSPIFFSCNTGYRLVGASSSYCTLFDRTLKWSEPLPECVEIYCPEPTQIDNGYIQEEHEVYVYRQSITYGCDKGFNLVGKSSIYCTVKENEGEWSDLPPQCIGKSSGSKPSPTAQKPTTVSVPGTRAPPTPQKPTTVNIPATRAPPTPEKPTTTSVPGTKASSKPQKTTTVNIPATRASPTPQKPTIVNAPATQRPPVPKATTSFYTTRVTEGKETSPSGAVSLIYGFVAAAIIIGILILVKIFWDYGKSGAHMYNFDSFACDARSHWLSDLAKEELRRKCTHVHRILVVC
ncbi:complement decay-accelerating factor isoform X3 [Marmota marmota marmota]|uniref:complement decay-accelerating factor isoform X3 n=1 Tax=Marmota marmota marmota TaxID=9994 RepID=UPI0020937FCD|nr:complement decay-accelerating factor isoform X3 [Marmota marmota marmota]